MSEVGSHLAIVVFGASGDLAKKKTFPALFGLYCQGELPESVKIIGYARLSMDHDKFADRVKEHLKGGSDDQKKKFLDLCSYLSGAYDKPDGFKKLNQEIEEFESKNKVEKTARLFYLALPPLAFTSVATNLKENVYDKKGLTRLVVEKPFGHDLESARELQKNLSPLFSEDETYRIDHYLGKEMVKNLLVMRFANEIFSGTWNKKHISHIQISFKEKFGTEGRGGYFDDIGIIRDVMQNHMLQVLTLLTMERPSKLDEESIRDEKVKVLKAFAPFDLKDILLGQYGKSEDGSKPGYLDDDTVKNDSKCVTYAAIGLKIKNDRWDGVPIVLRAGKALDESKVEVRIQFKPQESNLFKDVAPNELVIRIQPSEAVYLKIVSKIPGVSTETTVTDLDLTYSARYSKDFWIPEAYESLIRDCLKGNHSNFVRDDELDISWQLFTPLLQHIELKNAPGLEKYAYGSKGPQGLKGFLQDHGYVFTDLENYQWPVTKPDVKGKM